MTTIVQDQTRGTSAQVMERVRDAARAGVCPAFSTIQGVKWSWATRALDAQRAYGLQDVTEQPPRAGDVVLVEVERIGYHTRLTVAHDTRQRLYEGDRLVTVLGNRYATDAFEAIVDGVEQLHMLTGAGMVGTVVSKHQKMSAPTRLKCLGHLTDIDATRINLKSRQFRPTFSTSLPRNTIMVIGSGMNSGKTTTAAKVTRALVARGVRVAACKLTGSVSERDLSELQSTGAHDVRDFSSYGFPSTYLAAKHEIIGLFHTMLTDINRANPDVVIMEVADGMLQRETAMLLEDAGVKRSLLGVLLAATCAPSALFSVAQMERLGHELIGVSGCITSSPLFVRELAERSTIPIASSVGSGDELAALVLKHRALARLARTIEITRQVGEGRSVVRGRRHHADRPLAASRAA
jgi:hypothetical protein